LATIYFYYDSSANPLLLRAKMTAARLKNTSKTSILLLSQESNSWDG